MPLLSAWLRKKRFSRVRPYITGDVLDLGCGPAEIVRGGLSLPIDRYFGVDCCAEIVERNRSDLPQHQFAVRDMDEGRLDFDARFDSILMVALVEHIYNQKHLFKEARSLLKPHGRIIITTPTPLGNDLVHRVGASIGLFAKSAADDHIVIYNRKRFVTLTRDLDLRIEAYRTFQLGCNQLVVLAAN
jgi:SAM-dependent methyltransferase